MTGAIAVELPPADVASPYIDALLDSCNIEMQTRAPCVVARDFEPADTPHLAVAIVSWRGSERLEAHVEVGLRSGGVAHWQARDLTFSSADPEIERWRTLGFAIATLVDRAIAEGAEVSVGKPEPVDSIRQAPSADGAEVVNPSPPAWSRYSVDGQFVLQSGAAGANPATGGEIRFRRDIDPGAWFVGGGLRCTVQWLDVDQIRLLRPSVSAGAGIVLLRLGARIRVEARLAVALELIDASGQDPITGASGHGTRWLGGFEQGAEVVWMWSRGVGAVLGGELREAIGDTEIRAQGTPVARLPVLQWVGGAGVRVGFVGP
jgi:hypothetical protein